MRGGFGRRNVAPAGANGMADTRAHPVDLGGYLLQAGARCGHQANRTAAHVVGKTQRYAAQNGSAAIGAHHQHAALHGFFFERHLLRHWHVVAEHEDVQPCFHSFERFCRRIGAGYRDLGDIGTTQVGQAHADGARCHGFLGRAGYGFFLPGQVEPGLGDCISAGCCGAALNHHHDVAGPRVFDQRGEQTGFLQNLLVGRVAHLQGGIYHPRHGQQLLRHAHQGNRIFVQIGVDEGRAVKGLGLGGHRKRLAWLALSAILCAQGVGREANPRVVEGHAKIVYTLLAKRLLVSIGL